MPYTSESMTLLNRIQEQLQTIKLDETTLLVLSTEDHFSIGEQSDFGSDFTNQTLYLYANHIELTGDLHLTNSIISSSSITPLLSNYKMTANGARGQRGIATTNINGTEGKNGGNLAIFVETPCSISIEALGGKGGDGASVYEAERGGSGGNGGDGGTIQLIIVHDYVALLQECRRIRQLNSLSEKQTALIQLVRTDDGFNQELTDIFAALRTIQTLPTTAEIDEALLNINDDINDLLYAWKVNCARKLNVSGGEGGTYGLGKRNGTNGKVGKNGTTALSLVASPSLDDYPSFPWIHPIQCQMLLTKAQTLYFCLDEDDTDAIRQLIERFIQLRQRTERFALPHNESLTTWWKEHEQQIGATNSITVFGTIYRQANQLLAQLQQGLDYFGYPYNYVPVISFEFCRELLNESINYFSTIEQTFNETLDQATTLTEHKNALRTARTIAEKTMRYNETKIDQLLTTLDETRNTIDSYQTIIATQKDIVLQQLEQFTKQLEDYFDWNMKDMLNALGMIASAPSSSAKWAAEGAKLLYNGSHDITTDDGIKVDKRYLINKIQTIDDTIEHLKEGYYLVEDGTFALEDDNAAKLIAEAHKIQLLTDSVSNHFSFVSEKLGQAFRQYIRTVLSRNNHIMTYNSLLLLVVKTKDEQQQLQASIAHYNDQVITTLTKLAATDTLFISQTYYRSLSQVFQLLYLTTRAYNFWALDHKTIYNTLGEPTKLTANGLLAARSSILDYYKTAIMNFGTTSSTFPSRSKDSGIMYTLSDSEIDMFRKTGSTLVQIQPVTKETTIHDHPFASLANVRITKVRCWLEGIENKANVMVTITHQGQEQLISRRNERYSFNHSAREVPFCYTPEKKIVIDGDFGINTLSPNTNYALYGPFATWQIAIPPSYQKEIDFDQVTKITLEFHGTCYSFQ